MINNAAINTGNEEEQSGIENLNNIDKVILLLGKLNDLVRCENTFIDLMQLEEVEKLQPEKIKLGKWFQIFESYLKINTIWFSEQPEDKKKKLRKLYKEFDAVITENHKKLEKAIAVNEYIVKLVAREVKVLQQNVRYNRVGNEKIGTILASNDNSGLAITLNHSV